MNRHEQIVLRAVREDQERAGKALPVRRQWYIRKGRIFAAPTCLGELAFAAGPYTHREAHLVLGTSATWKD